MTAPDEHRFTPRRVLALDVATGGVDHPDPDRRADHPLARVLVCWSGDPIGMVDVAASDAELVPAVTEQAWRALRPELVAAFHQRGLPTPTSAADLALDVPAAAAVPAGDRFLVTVSIASFRNVDSTVDCVRRVLSSSWTALEVLVVDNDGDPTALGEALQAAFADDPRVRWVHEPRQGLSFARNAGLAAARGRIVVFTDDDVRVDHRWLERLVTAFDAADGVACVTGAILPAEHETQPQQWLEEYGGFHKGFQRQIFNATTHRRDTPLYPYDAGQFGSGANMAFRTDVLRAMGGFAVDLGAGTPAFGGEDLDVLQRTITAGHTIVYEPAALMWHYHRRSLSALRRQMFRYGIGLSATVTKWLVEDPRTCVAVLRRLPRGVLHVLLPASNKNKNKSAGFPRLLTALELLGILTGPVAYVRSRRRIRLLELRTG